MSSKIDLTGQVFGRLTVIEDVGRNKKGEVLWRCSCSCGEGREVVTKGTNLKSGNTESCGCLQKEGMSSRQTTHGMSKHPLYSVWCGIKDRCYNPKHVHYDLYGGKGVTLHREWLENVENFIKDLYPSYEKGLQLDRINNDGNYEPNNVRWVTNQQNQMNKRSNRNSSSKYKGVCWSDGKWASVIRKDGKNRFLGRFLVEEDAALAYNTAAIEMFGEYANLNEISTVSQL